MREIKFRGKSKEKGNLVYGWGCFTDESAKTFILLSENNWLEVEDIQEFTAFKDKNDKDIYEGDIVQLKNGICFVEWVGGLFTLKEVDPVTGHLIQYNGNLRNFCEGFWGGPPEVIGNICENPDLLK